MTENESQAMAGGLRLISRGLAEIAAVFEGSQRPGNDYDTRKAAAFRQFGTCEADGLDQAHASAALRENGLSPRMFGTWVGQGLMLRSGDRRWLSENGIQWLADYNARQSSAMATAGG